MEDETRRPTAIWQDPEVQRLLDGMTDPFMALDGKGTIAFANRALAERNPDIVGRDSREVWPELAGSEAEAALQATFATGVPARFEQWIESSGRWMDVSATSNGDYLLVHYRDVTDSKRREGSLRAIVDSLPHIAWLAEPGGTTTINDRWRDYTGIGGATLDDFRAAIHPDDLPRTVEALEGRKKGEAYEYDVRIRRADGVYRWNHVRAIPYLRRQGEEPNWIGTTTDVHDERTREHTLRLLLQVNEETRGLGDPAEIVLAAMRALATSLGKVSCFYGEFRDDGDTVDVLQEWSLDGVSEIGVYRLSDYRDPGREAFRMVVNDVREAYSERLVAVYEARRTAAFVCIPLVKEGRFSALLVARSAVPRDWAPEEIEAVRHVADRCWAEIERARAQSRAAAGEAGLRALVEANPIGVVVVDIDSGRALEANDAWLSALGRTRAELEAGVIDIRAMSGPEGTAITEAKIAEAREKGSVGFYEKAYFKPDGTRVPVLVGFAPVDPELKRATAFMLDLTELRRAEQAAVEGERRYRALAETIPAIAFSLLPDGAVEYVNSRGAEFFGEGMAQAALMTLGKLITHSESFEVERPLLRADRQYRWHLCRAEAMRDESGALVRWIGTLTDIHEAKSRERVLRFLVDLDDATATVEDPLQAMRETAYMLAGAVGADRCAYAEVDGERFTILGDYARSGPSISGEYRLADFGEAYANLQRSGETYVVENAAEFDLPPEVLANYEATAIAAVVCAPIIRAGRLVAMMAVHQNRPRKWTAEEISLVQQVTDRSWANIERVRARRDLRQSEERLREANDTLEQKVAERTDDLEKSNEALQGFGYHISHDLRTPLRAIVSTSRMIQADYGDDLPEEANALLSRQAEAARKLGELIDDLLQLSRLAHADLTKRPVDLTALARDAAAEALSAHPESNARIVVDDDLLVQADPRLLRLAIVNLLENAVKYSPEGGTIHVFQRSDGALAVTDEGIGMESQYLERIFEPFQRLHRDEAYKGTGIGLANVRRVIERHNGEVWAESEIGRGSTFLIRLP